MKTILSLDLDIGMSPYLGIYEKCINSENRMNNLTEINSQYDVSDFKFNSEYKKYLINIIQNYQSQVDKVYIGEDHGTILKALHDENIGFSNLNVFNVDYHHDINYHIEDQFNEDDVRSAFIWSAVNDWAGWLMYNGGNVHWYRGIGSELRREFLKYHSIVKINKNNFEEKIFDADFPMDLKIDLLYIVPSKPWLIESVDTDIDDILSVVDKDKIVTINGTMRDKENKKGIFS